MGTELILVGMLKQQDDTEYIKSVNFCKDLHIINISVLAHTQTEPKSENSSFFIPTVISTLLSNFNFS